MSEETAIKSKINNTMSSTITMHNDNIMKLNVVSKLDEQTGTLSSSAFNDDDVMFMINAHKDHLQKHRDVANINLLKVNSETKKYLTLSKT